MKRVRNPPMVHMIANRTHAITLSDVVTASISEYRHSANAQIPTHAPIQNAAMVMFSFLRSLRFLSSSFGSFGSDGPAYLRIEYIAGLMPCGGGKYHSAYCFSTLFLMLLAIGLSFLAPLPVSRWQNQLNHPQIDHPFRHIAQTGLPFRGALASQIVSRLCFYAHRQPTKHRVQRRRSQYNFHHGLGLLRQRWTVSQYRILVYIHRHLPKAGTCKIPYLSASA